jgi:Flp pilus assembly pilin Flp
MLRQVMRFTRDEDGQDLIEYALLASLIAIVGLVGMNAITGALNTTYDSWDTSNHDLWEPLPPE